MNLKKPFLLLFIIPERTNLFIFQLEAKIVKKIKLSEIPSASGIEVVDNVIYVIGDDSPYLYILNKTYKVFKKILLSSSYRLIKGKIPKTSKPDLEAVTSFDIGGEKVILILGSGSQRETRDKAFLVEPSENYLVHNFSLTPLYDLLRKNKEIVGERILNIEAAAVINQDIYLFQRGNISGNNAIIKFPVYEFLDFLKHKRSPAPPFEVYNFDFPKLHGLLPGFSGAANIPKTETLLFTTSLEDTPDEWYDGEIFESMIGIIEKDRKQFSYSIIYEGNEPFKGKIESLSLINLETAKKFNVLAVSDNDGESSELLWIEVKM
ncbi:hypothetical protein BH23BAC1_BH23BAC1_03040 [soil metagenome]